MHIIGPEMQNCRKIISPETLGAKKPQYRLTKDFFLKALKLYPFQLKYVSIHLLLLNFTLKTGSFPYVSFILKLKLLKCRNSAFLVSSQIRKQCYSQHREL